MANGNNATIGFEKQIWDAACVLWGHIPAAEYRKVIVGLIFLRYISNAFDSGNVQAVADFEKYDTHAKADSTPQNIDDESLNTYILSNLSNLLSGIAKPEEIEDLKGIIQSNFAVDWYKRDAIISKLRMSISGYYFVKLKDKKEAKEKAVQITTCLRQAVNDYTATNIKGGK
mgnify:CR=1 FL=1